MKLLSLVLFSLAYVCSLNAQPEKLGIIEVYGARTVSVADIRRAIGMKEGDTLDRKTLDKSATDPVSAGHYAGKRVTGLL
jgi:hypothetical protein